jgi:hypothetical protein
MLNRTRVSRGVDTQRIGAALARPGMDTRTWVSLAIAAGDSAVDPADGVFVDVVLHPTGETFTARVPAVYSGNGWGIYAPVYKDDELVVAVPSGDAAHGCVVMARPWNAADLPPADVLNVANQQDLIIVVQPDKNMRIRTSGAGQVFVDSAATVTVNCPDIRLGDIAPTDYAALAQKVLTELQNIQSYMVLVDTVLRTTPVPPQPPSVPDVLWTALQAAITATPYPTPNPVACATTKVK